MSAPASDRHGTIAAQCPCALLLSQPEPRHLAASGIVPETSPTSARLDKPVGREGECAPWQRSWECPCHRTAARCRTQEQSWSEGVDELRGKLMFTIRINDVGRIKSDQGRQRPVKTAPASDCVKHCLARLAVVSLAGLRRRMSAVAQFARTIEIRRLRGSAGSSFTSSSVSATPSIRRKLSSGMPSFISV